MLEIAFVERGDLDAKPQRFQARSKKPRLRRSRAAGETVQVDEAARHLGDSATRVFGSRCRRFGRRIFKSWEYCRVCFVIAILRGVAAPSRADIRVVES